MNNKTNELHDQHYNSISVQPIEFLQDILSKEQFEGAMLFNIVKYASRFGKKAGSSKEDEARKIYNYALALLRHEQDKDVKPKEFL